MTKSINSYEEIVLTFWTHFTVFHAEIEICKLHKLCKTVIVTRNRCILICMMLGNRTFNVNIIRTWPSNAAFQDQCPSRGAYIVH